MIIKNNKQIIARYLGNSKIIAKYKGTQLIWEETSQNNESI